MKKGVDIYWKASIINNCRCGKRNGKLNIMKINSECFRRKTLTSGIGSDKITFVAETSAANKKKVFEKVLDQMNYI